ncbi:MAG: hypothetical protein JWN72_467 [Thermoleophilia bacterium]|nr:hypothetical protein [Thermoleophilia bacterium]
MTQTTTVPTTTFNDGVTMPQLGFGVFRVPDDETQVAVEAALASGYRSIDTAAIYQNERGVGAAIAAAGIARDELFVTTKVWNTEQGYDSTLAAFEASRSKLGIDVVDLYLIHWPTSDQARRHETWRALERLKADGAVRSIGVSNFNIEHLEALAGEFETVPSLNQVELHPRFQQGELRAFHEEHGIATEAWGPIGHGNGTKELLANDTIVTIAERLGRTPAQVVLRWHVEVGNVVIPKSSKPERIAENIAVFDFELTDADHAAIDALDDPAGRNGTDPLDFD